MVVERMKVRWVPRLRWTPEQSRHTNTPCVTDAHTAPVPGQSKHVRFSFLDWSSRNTLALPCAALACSSIGGSDDIGCLIPCPQVWCTGAAVASTGGTAIKWLARAMARAQGLLYLFADMTEEVLLNFSASRSSTASTGNDEGTKRRGFMLKSVITHGRTTHEGLKVPPNAPDGLVVS